jgi:hypothetical protein
MFTMFMALTLEGWNDLVLITEEYYPPETSVPPKLFFMTYVLIVVQYVLCFCIFLHTHFALVILRYFLFDHS